MLYIVTSYIVFRWLCKSIRIVGKKICWWFWSSMLVFSGIWDHHAHLLAGQARGRADPAIGHVRNVRAWGGQTLRVRSGPLTSRRANLLHFRWGHESAIATKLALCAHVEEAVDLLAVAPQVAVIRSWCRFARCLLVEGEASSPVRLQHVIWSIFVFKKMKVVQSLSPPWLGKWSY